MTGKPLAFLWDTPGQRLASGAFVPDTPNQRQTCLRDLNPRP